MEKCIECQSDKPFDRGSFVCKKCFNERADELREKYGAYKD